ncbi:histone H1 [Roseovarius litorisediminis]|nr:histone H1 [Roseovarius litorisediminis]
MTDKPKRPRDANQLAHMIAGIVTGEDVKHEPDTSGQRKGGLKGGKARAKVLNKGRKREIAKDGATARWKKSERQWDTVDQRTT